MIKFTNTENTLNCIFKGHFSANNTEMVEKQIQEKVDELKNDQLIVNFNLLDVDYIASSFIRICITTAKQLTDGNFRISNTNPMIKKVFKISGLDEILNIS
ncbi:MAG: STAS domain-containing protein [Bacteroidetes bacterium]|nr:STAS domain-containing protein [Bacteroidota bacterium]